jgi:hypothetical protein
VNAHTQQQASNPAAAPLLTLSARLPDTLSAGLPSLLSWEIRNHGITPVSANLYLRMAPAELLALSCTSGRTQRGRYHGSAALLLQPGKTTTVRAHIQPPTTHQLELRTTLAGDNETLEERHLLDIATATGDSSSRRPHTTKDAQARAD